MSSEEFDFSPKTVSTVQICLTALIPIALMCGGFSLLFFIIDKKEENMPKAKKVKNLFYYVAQFLFMPFLLLFFLTNAIVIIVTYFFCANVYYFTGKDIVRRINVFKLCNCDKCKKCLQEWLCYICKGKNKQEVNTIKISSSKSVPEEKKANVKDNEKSDLPLNVDANIPINELNNKTKNENLNKNEQKVITKTSDYPRPITNKKPNKSKIIEFINSVLANTNDKDDEGPIYINLLNKAKNKMKDSKQKNKIATPNIYNSNLPKDKY